MDSSPWLGVYLRKSRDKTEVADPELLSKHRRELLLLARGRGDEVPPSRVFEEIGSGEKIDRRPVFLSLLQEIEGLPRGHGGRLYTTEVSRLTRGDLAARGRIQGALQRAQIRHITRGREYDLTSADDRFVWEIEAGVSGYELGRYKQRVDAARIDMAREGRLRTGKPPMGWQWDRNLKRPVPTAQFPIVQALCRDAVALSTYELAEKYGIHPATILNLLRNPFIAGWPAKRWFPHNGERDWIGPSHLLKPEQWIWPTQQADYPAACTLDEWHAIQAALDKRRDLREKRFSDNGWCRDILRFEGYEEIQPRLGVWKCPNHRVLTYEITPRGVPRLYIDREVVHRAAKSAILAMLADHEMLHRQLERLAKAPQSPIASIDAGREIAALEGKLDALMDMQAEEAGAGNAEALASIKRRRAAIEKELKVLRAQSVAARSPHCLTPSTIALLRVVSEKAEPFWDKLPVADQRAIAQALLGRVWARITPGRRSHTREIVGIEWAAVWRMGE